MKINQITPDNVRTIRAQNVMGTQVYFIVIFHIGPLEYIYSLK